jgi:hypothetical protein
VCCYCWQSRPTVRCAVTCGVFEHSRVGLCTAACKLGRGWLGPCVAPRRALPVVSTMGTHGSRRVGPGGRTRNESRAVAVRVRSWSQRGAPRIPSWLQKSSSSVWPREATSVAAAVGDGGLALAGRLASAKDVDGFGCRRRSSDPSVRGEPLGGGRRLGSWQPSSFTGRRGKRSWPGDVWRQAPRPMVTEASESQQVHPHGRRRGDRGRGPSWAKRAA